MATPNQTWRSRSTVIAQIKSKLKGYPPALVSTVIAQLDLPSRLSASEATAIYSRATSMASDYQRIQSGSNPQVYQPGQGGMTTTNLIDQTQAQYGSGTQSAASTAAKDLKAKLVQPFIDGGWRDPYAAASLYWGRVDQIAGNNPDPRVRAANVDLVYGIAARFGKNESAARSFWEGNKLTYLPDPDQVTMMDGSQNDNYGFDPYGGGYSGGGGGYAGPTYVKPDRRVIEDMVKGQLATYVGRADDASIQSLTDLYMAEHRRDFDTPEQQIDPRQSVTMKIREREDFKRIHALRPDYIDEAQWVPQYQTGALQSGMSAQAGEQFAINQATVGTQATSIGEAATTAAYSQGEKIPEFIQRAKSAASAVLSGVR